MFICCISWSACFLLGCEKGKTLVGATLLWTKCLFVAHDNVKSSSWSWQSTFDNIVISYWRQSTNQGRKEKRSSDCKLLCWAGSCAMKEEMRREWLFGGSSTLERTLIKEKLSREFKNNLRRIDVRGVRRQVKISNHCSPILANNNENLKVFISHVKILLMHKICILM